MLESTPSGTTDPELRIARFEDSAAVVELMRRNGLHVDPTSVNWHWLWRENPAVPQGHNAWTIGWTLVADERVVGFLGNVPLAYWLKGKRLLAAAARGFVVDPAYRSFSLRLASAFFSQTGIHLLLNTSANGAAGAVFRLYKADPIPQPDYDKVLFWIFHPSRVLSAYLRKRGLPAGIARACGVLLAPLAKAEGFIRKRRPKSVCSGIPVTQLAPDEVGTDFDRFWELLVATHPDRLLCDRSSASLRWHFRRATGQAVLLGAWRGKALLGYAAVLTDDPGRLGLRTSRIADLIALGDNAAVIDCLLVASADYAARHGSDLLEMSGFPRQVRARAAAAHPYVLGLGYWPYWFKAITPTLAPAVSVEQTWYGCPFDGDASL